MSPENRGSGPVMPLEAVETSPGAVLLGAGIPVGESTVATTWPRAAAGRHRAKSRSDRHQSLEARRACHRRKAGRTISAGRARPRRQTISRRRAVLSRRCRSPARRPTQAGPGPIDGQVSGGTSRICLSAAAPSRPSAFVDSARRLPSLADRPDDQRCPRRVSPATKTLSGSPVIGLVRLERRRRSLRTPACSNGPA